MMDGIGAHEVIIESPTHHKSMADASATTTSAKSSGSIATGWST